MMLIFFLSTWKDYGHICVQIKTSNHLSIEIKLFRNKNCKKDSNLKILQSEKGNRSINISEVLVHPTFKGRQIVRGREN